MYRTRSKWRDHARLSGSGHRNDGQESAEDLRTVRRQEVCCGRRAFRPDHARRSVPNSRQLQARRNHRSPKSPAIHRPTIPPIQAMNSCRSGLEARLQAERSRHPSCAGRNRRPSRGIGVNRSGSCGSTLVSSPRQDSASLF